MKKILAVLILMLSVVLVGCSGSSGVKKDDISDEATDEEKELIIKIIDEYSREYEKFDVDIALDITKNYLSERETTSNVFAYLNTDEKIEHKTDEVELYHDFLLEVSTVHFQVD